MRGPSDLLRPIDKSDFETLYSIDQACFANGVAYSRFEMRWFMSRRGAFGFVAELPQKKEEAGSSEHSVIGFILAWKGQKQVGHIITLDVLEPYRRQSLGSRLMRQVEERFRENGVRIAVLEVSAENHAAMEFYKKFGYQVTERMRGYYPNGEDAFEMVRWFDA